MTYKKLISKYCIICIPSIYILLLFSCTPTLKKHEPAIYEINKDFDFLKINSIGIYVYPSNNAVIDRTLKNVLSLHFITLGYKIVDIDNTPNHSLSTIVSGFTSKDPQKHLKNLNLTLFMLIAKV